MMDPTYRNFLAAVLSGTTGSPLPTASGGLLALPAGFEQSVGRVPGTPLPAVGAALPAAGVAWALIALQAQSNLH
jgi:hypothetical protein